MTAVRIEGVVMESEKHIRIAVQSIFGIGPARAEKICRKIGADGGARFKTLSENQIKALQAAVGEYRVEGDLRREVSMHIKHLRDVGCYRGLRHKRGLPVRGQRTRTNARTRKGPRGNRVALKKQDKS